MKCNVSAVVSGTRESNNLTIWLICTSSDSVRIANVSAVPSGKDQIDNVQMCTSIDVFGLTFNVIRGVDEWKSRLLTV